MIPRVRIRQLAIVLALVGSASCSEDSQVESRNREEDAPPIAHRGEDPSDASLRQGYGLAGEPAGGPAPAY